VQLSEPREWRDGGHLVTTDPQRVDVDAVIAMLSTTYWASGRTRDANVTAITSSSRCYSVLDDGGRQVGFARAITDWSTFAWVADVVLLEDVRGGGLGTFLMRCVTDDLRDVRRIVLATRDAHDLYTKVGFVPLVEPARWMERLLSG
jgi:N-acetylglutamate synthase-like GNAT family acetyltransferase